MVSILPPAPRTHRRSGPTFGELGKQANAEANSVGTSACVCVPTCDGREPV